MRQAQILKFQAEMQLLNQNCELGNMNITQAEYIKTPFIDEVKTIKATIDSVVMWIPISDDNRRYAEIMRQVEAGELTIEPADEEE